MTNEEEDHARKIKRLLDSEANTHAEPTIEPNKDEDPNSDGTTKTHSPNSREGERKTPTPPVTIALDKDNMPLPRRVHEVDMEGTRVSPVAYESSMSRTKDAQPQPPPRRAPPPTPVNSHTQPWRVELGNLNLRRSWGCLMRLFVLALFGVVVFGILGGSALVVTYYRIARTLPSVADLKNRASQFETTRILDRNG